MEKILLDIEYFLLFPLRISEKFFQIGALIYVILGLIVFILFTWTYIAWRIGRKKSLSKQEDDYVMPNTHTQGTKEPTAGISPEGFGKIVDKEYVTCAGKKYKYFIIKDKDNTSHLLAVNTIVVILKRNAKEAHVRAATKEEITSIKKRGIVLH
jgi:hypothetical protein